MKLKALQIHLFNTALLVFWALYNFLAYHSYSLFKLEVLLSFLVCIAVLALPLVLFYALKKVWIYYAFLLFIWIDLIGGWAMREFWHLQNLEGVSHFGRYAYLVGLMLCLIPTYFLRNKIELLFRGLFLILIGVAIAESLLVPQKLVNTEQGNQIEADSRRKDNVLVVVLDEHIGMEGMWQGSDQAREFKEKLINQYQKLGFELHGRAYTNYYFTNDSFPNFLNYDLVQTVGGIDPTKLESSRLFDRWTEDGYTLDIYQNDFIDLCGHLDRNYGQCHQYKANSIGHIQDVDLSIRDKTALILTAYINAHKSQIAYVVMRKILDIWHIRLPYVHPFSSQTVLSALSEDIKTGISGKALFVHVMLPHYPYVYDSKCRVKEFEDWEIAQEFQGSTYEKRNAALLEQTICLHQSLSLLFELMKSEGVYESTTIILMGDHGSRIEATNFSKESVGDLKRQQLIDAFSAFYAIKPAGRHPGSYIETQESVTNLLNQQLGVKPAEGLSPEIFQKIYLSTPIGQAPIPGENMPEGQEMPPI